MSWQELYDEQNKWDRRDSIKVIVLLVLSLLIVWYLTIV